MYRVSGLFKADANWSESVVFLKINGNSDFKSDRISLAIRRIAFSRAPFPGVIINCGKEVLVGKILKGDFENLYKLANDVEKLMDTIDQKRFDKIDPNWSSELNDLSDKISKKNNYDLIFNIQYDEEWSEYLEGIRENVFNSLLKKLENPEL